MPDYDGDAQARRSKALITAGRRLPGDVPIAREYFCRTCGRVERGDVVPSGWYRLQRESAVIGRPVRLGLYCSMTCLTDMLPRLEGVDADLGERDWEHRAAGSAFPQRRTGRVWRGGSRR